MLNFMHFHITLACYRICSPHSFHNNCLFLFDVVKGGESLDIMLLYFGYYTLDIMFVSYDACMMCLFLI